MSTIIQLKSQIKDMELRAENMYENLTEKTNRALKLNNETLQQVKEKEITINNHLATLPTGLATS